MWMRTRTFLHRCCLNVCQQILLKTPSLGPDRMHVAVCSAVTVKPEAQCHTWHSPLAVTGFDSWVRFPDISALWQQQRGVIISHIHPRLANLHRPRCQKAAFTGPDVGKTVVSLLSYVPSAVNYICRCSQIFLHFARVWMFKRQMYSVEKYLIHFHRLRNYLFSTPRCDSAIFW